MEKESQNKAANVLRPENRPNLAIPRVKLDIWSIMDCQSFNRDLTLQKIQVLTHKSIMPMLRAPEKAEDKRGKDCILRLGGCFQAIGHRQHGHLTSQKNNTAGDLKKAIRSSGAPSRPITFLLFGDDLSKDTKNIRNKNVTGE